MPITGGINQVPSFRLRVHYENVREICSVFKAIIGSIIMVSKREKSILNCDPHLGSIVGAVNPCYAKPTKYFVFFPVHAMLS